MSVVIQGFSIAPPPVVNPNSPPSVSLYTYFGTIVLVGTQLLFDSGVPDVFVQLGFSDGSIEAGGSTSTGRRLLGIGELVGLFNYLDSSTVREPSAASRTRL